ncbi:uncharacterized protein LOC107517942 isoform X2 [Rousettus aegyptiacus]|uniref:uncharacterized protein LOC107517942 isoform X2 n=1 Tax=Rousettus aegyptiacus TaxID=9407 RepID=UPI00168D1060|nr:uncharacterized protein LOC107517942 isoform X2 [Rousettus aegyptiacus]
MKDPAGGVCEEEEEGGRREEDRSPRGGGGTGYRMPAATFSENDHTCAYSRFGGECLHSFPELRCAFLSELQELFSLWKKLLRSWPITSLLLVHGLISKEVFSSRWTCKCYTAWDCLEHHHLLGCDLILFLLLHISNQKGIF